MTSNLGNPANSLRVMRTHKEHTAADSVRLNEELDDRSSFPSLFPTKLRCAHAKGFGFAVASTDVEGWPENGRCRPPDRGKLFAAIRGFTWWILGDFPDGQAHFVAWLWRQKESKWWGDERPRLSRVPISIRRECGLPRGGHVAAAVIQKCRRKREVFALSWRGPEFAATGTER